MEFASFALLMIGLIAGFLPGMAVGWHAHPNEVRLVKHEQDLEARDNEIVMGVRGRRSR
jgi:hypothetical protein